MILASAAFLLTLQPAPALPAPDGVRWEALPGGDPTEPLAIDPRSIVRRGDRVTLTVHARRVGRSPPPAVLAYVSRWTVDCRAQVITIEATDEYGADGARFPSDPAMPAPAVSLPLNALTGGAGLAARVCQARR